MTKAASASSISFVSATTSFALGMVAALPELMGSATFQRLRPTRDRLMDLAPAGGHALDGYDFIAGISVRRWIRRRNRMLARQASGAADQSADLAVRS